MNEFMINTTKHSQLIDITKRLNEIVSKSDIENGVLTVFIPHTTAGVTINENGDPDVKRDILFQLDKMVPNSDYFKHFEGNSDAHVKSSMMGVSLQVLVVNSALHLGTWQSVYFCEFDGPRHRKIWVDIK